MTDQFRLRFQQLLDSVLDRSCSDDELSELTEIVRHNSILRTELASQLQLHSLLRWQCGELPANHLLPIGPNMDEASSGRTPIARLLVARWKWIAAAVVLLAAGGIWNAVRSNSADSSIVAEIVDDQRVVWTSQSSARRNEKDVVPGRIEMQSGTLTLRFRSGVTVSATGDVSMRIDSDMLVWLDRGQATADVPKDARGFTIKTPYVEVIDLGTRFGVLAREKGATDVVVFEGQVDLRPTGPSEKVQKRLSEGEGVRIHDQGSIDRIVELRHDTSGGRWTTESPSWSDSTFKSISDNIPSAARRTYYQINPRGFGEDCRAYTDLAAEWNGLTSDGLPEFLRHADFVMMRNDYRYMNGFEMLIELAQPANLYVFFDHRVPVPAWLSEQFENIGIDIGLDEGPWDDKHSLAQGGGNSIDNVFSVWRRRCNVAETLKLGPMGSFRGARAMYGIAAQPLETGEGSEAGK